jgi:hypothetical protein
MRIHHEDGFSGIQVPPPAPFWQIVRIRFEKRHEYNTDISIPEDQKGVKELLSRPLFGIPLT